jgi:hypothetical protein
VSLILEPEKSKILKDKRKYHFREKIQKTTKAMFMNIEMGKTNEK